MFFSACGPNFQTKFTDLVRFVLQKTECNMPHNIRVYAYLLDPKDSTAYRQAGLTGRSDIGRGNLQVFAEISFAPFGFILSPSGKVVDPRLTDITYFAQYPFHLKQALYLKLHVLPVASPFPGDFRTTEQIAATVLENRRIGEYHLS